MFSWENRRLQGDLSAPKGAPRELLGEGLRMRDGVTGHRQWLPTARGQGEMGYWEGIVPIEGAEGLVQLCLPLCDCPCPDDAVSEQRIGRQTHASSRPG